MIKTPFTLLLALSTTAAAQTKPAETDLYFADESARKLFSSPDAWKTRQDGPVTLTPESSHGHLNLIFRAKPAAEYTVENDLIVGEKPFAIHSITLAPPTARLAHEPSRVTIQGNPLVLLPGAQGTAPSITLGARDPLKEHAVFDIATNLLASGKLHLTGDGNQTFRISGRIAPADAELSVVKSGVSTVELTSANQWTGATRVLAGAIVLREGDSLGSGPLELAAGAVVRFEDLTPRAGLSTALTLAEESKLDLNGNAWVIDYTGESPLALIEAMVRDERITTTSQQPNQTIAWIEASSLARPEYAQRMLDDSTVIITVARQGDANLDGAVNAEDLERVNRFFNKSGDWTNGDFTRDGKVDFDDLLRVSQNYDAAGQFEADWNRLRRQPR